MYRIQTPVFGNVLTFLDKITKKSASIAFYTDILKQCVFQDVKFLSMTHCLSCEKKTISKHGVEFYSVLSDLNADAVVQRR